MITGLGGYLRMTAGEEAELLSQHRAAVEFALETLPAARFRGVATAVTRAVLARAYYSADHGQLRHFASVLQSGVATSERDQPIALLLKSLMEAAQKHRGRPEARAK